MSFQIVFESLTGLVSLFIRFSYEHNIGLILTFHVIILFLLFQMGQLILVSLVFSYSN